MTMPIPLIHEDYSDMSLQEAFNVENILEACFFCKGGTRFWHQASNQPVCPVCAQFHSASELPRLKAKDKEVRIKPLGKSAIELHAENDSLRIEEAKLENQRLELYRRKITLHRKMKDANLVIKNPIK
jgi:hypothetical protein